MSEPVIQFRTPREDGGPVTEWGPWQNSPLPGMTIQFNSQVQLRIKPVFKPGFFSNGDKLVEWWYIDRRGSHSMRNWVRVEVTVVDLD
jgi:hypothetical protein